MLIAVVATAVAMVAAWRWLARRPAPSGIGARPHFVDERPAAASTTRTPASSSSSSVAGSPRSTATTTGSTSCTSPAAPSPPRCTATRAQSVARCGSSKQQSPATDLTEVTGAYPLDVDSDGHTDLAVLRRGGNAVLRGLGRLRVRGCHRGTRHRRRRRLDRRVQRHLGGCELAADARVRQLPRTRPARLRRQPARATRRRPATATPPRSRSRPATARCRCCSATGDDRASATCAWPTTGTTTATARSSCGGSTPTTRRVSTPRPTAGGSCRSGAWASPATTSPATASPEVFITSQGDNKLQTLESGAGPADVPRHRASNAASPRSDRTPAATCCRPPPGTPSSTTSTTTASSTCSSARATWRPRWTTPSRDPSNLLIGQPDGTFVEGAEAAGISAFDRAAGRALVDLNLDGLLDLVVVNRQANVTVRRNVGAGDADAARADGSLARRAPAAAAPNVDAIGAWVEVRAGGRTDVREVTVGGGHAGRPARMDPRRARRRADGRGGACAVARRRDRPVDDGGGRSVRRHRARCDGSDSVVAERLTDERVRCRRAARRSPAS